MRPVAAAQPVDVADALGALAATVAALPQTLAQLRSILDACRRDQLLVMDGMVEETDPNLAVDLADHRLDEARDAAVRLHELIHAAHQPTAHIASHGTPLHD